MLFVQNIQRFHPVGGGNGLVAVLAEHRLHELAGVDIVFDHQNPEHEAPPYTDTWN